MFASLTLKSRNVKTGRIPVSMTEAASCPTTCPWIDKGCYAKYGPISMCWRSVKSRGSAGAMFCKQITKIKAGALWRHNQAGDLPGKGNGINFRMLKALVAANVGKRGFTYSHKPVLGVGVQRGKNRAAIAYANKNGFVVNLSADSLCEADSLAALDIAPVCVIVSTNSDEKMLTPEGRKVIVCPAQIRDDVTCKSCKLCAVINRKVIIAFQAHGPAGKTVSEKVR